MLTPIPRGDSLGELSERMQAEVDRLGALRAVAFEARRLQPVSVSRSALPRVDGA